MNLTHAKIADYVRRYMLKHASAGDPVYGERRATARYWHTLSVYRNLNEILLGEKADDATREVCEIAALFHDVDSYTVEHAYHGERGAETATNYLRKDGYDDGLIAQVAQVIRDHNYDFDDERPAAEQVTDIARTYSKASLYVLDADVLDKIGATNILAAVMPMGLNNKHAYEAAQTLGTWPLERAQFWYDLLTTKTGRLMGAQRFGFFQQFIKQLEIEIAMSDPFAEGARLFEGARLWDKRATLV
jgi:HD superfamily phosphodiesterase